MSDRATLRYVDDFFQLLLKELREPQSTTLPELKESRRIALHAIAQDQTYIRDLESRCRGLRHALRREIEMTEQLQKQLEEQG